MLALLSLWLFARLRRRNLAVHGAREPKIPRSWPPSPPPIPGAGGCKDKEAKKAADGAEGISARRPGGWERDGEGDVGRGKKKEREERWVKGKRGTGRRGKW